MGSHEMASAQISGSEVEFDSRDVCRVGDEGKADKGYKLRTLYLVMIAIMTDSLVATRWRVHKFPDSAPSDYKGTQKSVITSQAAILQCNIALPQ